MAEKNLIKILYVDDDADDFWLLATYLRKIRQFNHEVEHASSIEQANEFIGNQTFDIYLLDYKLGAGTGIELLKEIRKAQPFAPVILLTGMEGEEPENLALREGANDYLVKGSFNEQLLQRTIRYAIRDAEAMAQAKQKEEEEFSQKQFATSGRMARILAHEVKNPLTNINLALDQLKFELPEKIVEEMGDLLDIIEKNSKRINALVSQLLNSTRFAEINLKEEDVHQMLEESIQAASDSLKLNGIAVQTHFEADSAMVNMDSEKMKLVFFNLIVNAIEAMEAGKGLLQIATSTSGEKILIEIKDNGSGIEADKLERLFEPFFTTKSNGTGLGLTNAQSIVLSHKGHMRAKSQSGQGTSFQIFLPLAHPAQ